MRLCLKAILTNDPSTLAQIILDMNRMLYLKQTALKDRQMHPELQVK